MMVAGALVLALSLTAPSPMTSAQSPLGRTSGASGTSTAVLDTLYLRLDGTNDMSGVLSAIGGTACTAGNLGIEFVGDTDTGFADTTGNVVDVCVGGAVATRTNTGGFTVNENTTLGTAGAGDLITFNASTWTVVSDTTVALSGGVNGINFDTNTLSIDGTNNRIGVGTAAPTFDVDVSRTANASVTTRIHNGSAGTVANAGVLLNNNTGTTDNAQFFLTSTGYTAADLLTNTMGALGVNANNGLLIYTDSLGGGTPPIIFAVGATVGTNFGNEKVRITQTEVIVNDASLANASFRVETDGDAAALNIDATANTFQAGLDVTPDITDTLALGSGTLQWNELHLDTSVAAAPAIDIENSNTGIAGGATSLTLAVAGATMLIGSGTTITMNSSGSARWVTDAASNTTHVDILPNASNTLDIGSTAAVFAEGHFTQGLFSSAGDDIMTETDADLRIASTTQMQLAAGDMIVRILDTADTTRGLLRVDTNAANRLTIQSGTGTGTSGTMHLNSTTAIIGRLSNLAGTDTAGCIGDTLTTTGGTCLLAVRGDGTGVYTQGTAISITSTPDTTTSPLGAGTACLMSATGASAWTPSETNAAAGMHWCCTNTGANAITMTDSDGVYEGPGSVVGQYDSVCFEYIGDRFVERSFSNNEP